MTQKKLSLVKDQDDSSESVHGVITAVANIIATIIRLTFKKS